MSFEKFKAWAKLVFIIVLIAVVVTIILKNSEYRTDLWLFHTFRAVSVLWLLIVTAVVSPIGWAIVKNVYHACRDVKAHSGAVKDNDSPGNKDENVEVEQ